MPYMRVGLGHDLHRLEPTAGGEGRLRLGGLTIPSSFRAVAHSDGDVVLHALTDALLGALAAGDLGDLFPNTSAENRDRDSSEFVAEACRRMRAAGYAVANVDIDIHLERPRLGPYKPAIRERVAAILEIPSPRVSVKAKTAEGLGPIGAGEAVAAEAVVLLRRVAAPPEPGRERSAF